VAASARDRVESMPGRICLVKDDSTMPIIKDSDTTGRRRDLGALNGEPVTVAGRTAVEQRLRRVLARRCAGVDQNLLALQFKGDDFGRTDALPAGAIQ
jgi:hypothetical protein